MRRRSVGAQETERNFDGRVYFSVSMITHFFQHYGKPGALVFMVLEYILKYRHPDTQVAGLRVFAYPLSYHSTKTM